MRGFTRGERGYISSPVAAVRELLAMSVEQVAEALERPVWDVPDLDSDEAILEALDFDVDPRDRELAAFVPPEPGPITDPALARLLPTMSLEDPDLAAELRRSSERRIRSSKAQHLKVLHEALVAPRPTVEIAFGDEGAALAAMTDVRLLLSERLGLRTATEVVRLHDTLVTDEDDAPCETPKERQIRMLSQVYLYFTWWQDSLLEAMGEAADTP
ncbi:MAG: DUF2017 family protein [Bowdeniella nasicola]|nr:DUF2017 family protein [Bowdeniella nasicola]